MGRALVFAAIVLGVAVLAQRTDAADISRSEPNFLISCNEVFADGRVTAGYIDVIADFAFPRAPQAPEAKALGAPILLFPTGCRNGLAGCGWWCGATSP